MPEVRCPMAFTILMAVWGCAAKSEPPPPPPDPVAEAVRAVVAERLKMDPSAVAMDLPLCDQRADELDLIEICETLERRQKIVITEAAVAHYIGESTGHPNITPNQLATIVKEAPKAKQTRTKRTRSKS